MTSVAPTVTRRVAAPSWPTVLLATLALLATISLAQGIVDVVLPTVSGEEPFGFLLDQTARLGPGFFIAYVFLHNLGLAALVPGYGFLAAYFERRTQNRALIGLLLAAAVVASLLVALEFLIQARERFDLARALVLFTVEASAVLAVAIPAARQLKGFVPTRRYDWSLVTPFRKLRAPLVYAATVLLLVSGVEAWMVLA